MPRIELPEGPGSRHDRMYSLRPPLAEPARRVYEAVTRDSILPPRLRELMRYRIAQINGCLMCLEFRDPSAAGLLTEDDYADVERWRRSDRFAPEERLGIEYAELFCVDHRAMDDSFFERVRVCFSDAEIIDLTFLASRYLGFGRLTHVLGLDDACTMPLIPQGSEQH